MRLLRERRDTHGIDPFVHAVQASHSGSLPNSLPGETDALQLLKCHEAVLPPRKPSNLTVNSPPTGRKPIYFIGLRPVGGGGWGHIWSIEGQGARVVR